MQEILAKAVSIAERAGYKSVSLRPNAYGILATFVTEEETEVLVEAEPISPEERTHDIMCDPVEGDRRILAYTTMDVKHTVQLNGDLDCTMDDAEFKKLAESVYNVGWMLRRKGLTISLERHHDVGGRADMSKRFAYLIGPLKHELAAANAAFAG